MKIKATLIAAATLAVGVISSQAQVYSQNIVGYVNLTLTNGYNLVANQLDYDGTGTNNTLVTCIGTNLPNGTQAYAYVAGSYVFATYSASAQKWSGNTNACNAALSVGHGLFIKIPSSATYPQTLTEVGNVIIGTNVNNIAAGYQLCSYAFPISGSIQTGLNYTPTHGDRVYVYNPVTASYTFSTFNSGTTWVGGAPNLSVGQAVFLQAAANTNWTQIFTPQ
jgi:hypothetical protein